VHRGQRSRYLAPGVAVLDVNQKIGVMGMEKVAIMILILITGVKTLRNPKNLNHNHIKITSLIGVIMVIP
jgi:hypothetical protein